MRNHTLTPPVGSPDNPAVCQLCLSHKTGSNTRELGLCPLCARELDHVHPLEAERMYRRGTLIENQARRARIWAAAVEEVRG